MKTKTKKTRQADGADEYTLEGWLAERRRLEAEMAADSAALKSAMDEALARDDLPPEMKAVIQASGTKLLELDEWLHEMHDWTEDTIRQCDEMIARIDATDNDATVETRFQGITNERTDQ